jgi:tetratricopeptide (TPR) repeat protein
MKRRAGLVTTLTTQLSRLEATSLISLARTEPELEYIFRHALIQEVAYDSLLKAERQSLHLAAGEVLEELYQDRLEEFAPRLAEHFWNAGDERRAQLYSVIAAESAARTYANQEAIMHYTRALQASTLQSVIKANLLQARGELYEIMGEFDLAQADQEASLEEARSANDLRSEWQGLVNLGALWAARDYRKTGEYYRHALKIARQIKDPKLLGHSLNRLANYYINVEEPEKSQKLHLDALSIFQDVGDASGIAETMDYLGMAYAIGGEIHQAKRYLQQAIDHFRELNDQKGLASSLASLAFGTVNYQSDILVTTGIRTEEGIQFGFQALEISRSIGWRSGEVYSLATIGMCQVSLGQYDQALTNAFSGLEIAEQIQHHQWKTLTRLVLGSVYLELFAFPEAVSHLQEALALARQNYSLHWLHVISGALASVEIAMGDPDSAARLLDEVLPPDTPMQTIGQRLAWTARAELAYIQGDLRRAIELIDQLTQATTLPDYLRAIVRLDILQGKAFNAMAEKSTDPEEKKAWLERAENALNSALKEAQEQNYRTKTWRIYLLLAKGYHLQGRQVEAEKMRSLAHEIIHELANNIRDEKLRENFTQHAV